MTNRATGLLPRREQTRASFAAGALAPVSGQRATVVQPIVFVRDQAMKPSCVGQAFAACVEALDRRCKHHCSAVDLWVDARRRQNNLEGVQDGTRLEYAIASLCSRGWSTRTPGEDTRPMTSDAVIPELASELVAYDMRYVGVKHYAITRNRVDTTIAALRAGYGVVMSAGVYGAYGNPPKNTVLGDDYLGGTANGHAQRIFGYIAESECFLVQNSWGARWGGYAYSGALYEGCCAVSHSVIDNAWDIDVIAVP